MGAAAAGSINLTSVDHNRNMTVDTWDNASDAWDAYNRRESVVVIESAAADQQPINVMSVMDELNRCLQTTFERIFFFISKCQDAKYQLNLLSADDVLCGGSCNGCAPNGTIGGPLRSSSSPFNRPAD